jgi:NADPH:quinone reductase-like Zn-dependent oxidoreductase
MIEYVRATSDLVWSVPSHLSLREAAGVSATLATAAQGLFTKLDLPYPVSGTNPTPIDNDPTNWIVIYGGSSSVGLFAIQLAKFAGYNVITTCSPKNFDLVKQYGADVVVDYHNPEAAIQKIRSATSAQLTRAFDCISADNSAIVCLQALEDADEANDKCKLVQVAPPSPEAEKLASERGIEMSRLMALTLFGNVNIINSSPLSLLPRN